MHVPNVFRAEAIDELVGGDQAFLHELRLLLQALPLGHGRLVLGVERGQQILQLCQLLVDLVKATLQLEEVLLKGCHLKKKTKKTHTAIYKFVLVTRIRPNAYMVKNQRI